MGAIQNAVNQAIGSVGVALHSNDLKKEQPKKENNGPSGISHASRVSQALDPDRNQQGAETQRRVLKKQQEMKNFNAELNNKIKDKIAADELRRMK